MFKKEDIISKNIVKKEGIHTKEDADRFMDKIADNLRDYDLKRAYDGAKKKFEKKPNNSTRYIMTYFHDKCIKRGIKL